MLTPPMSARNQTSTSMTGRAPQLSSSQVTGLRAPLTLVEDLDDQKHRGDHQEQVHERTPCKQEPDEPGNQHDGRGQPDHRKKIHASLRTRAITATPLIATRSVRSRVR